MVHGYLVKAKTYREQYPDDNVVTSDSRLWIIQNYGTWLPESCYEVNSKLWPLVAGKLLQVNSDDHARTVLR